MNFIEALFGKTFRPNSASLPAFAGPILPGKPGYPNSFFLLNRRAKKGFFVNSAKNRQLARLLHLVPLLLEGDHTRDELIEALAAVLTKDDLGDALPAHRAGENATSTFDRDWKTLRDLGLLEPLPGRKYRTRPGPRLPLWVTPAESQALEAARHALTQLGVPEERLLEDMLKRVGSKRGAGLPRWSLAPSLRDISPEVWDGVQTGVARGRMLKIVYRYPDRDTLESRVLDRGRILWMTGAFYLCAVRPDLVAGAAGPFDSVREYRLDRIQEVTVLNDPVRTAIMPTLRVVFMLSAELVGRLQNMDDGDGRRVQTVETLSDRTTRVSVEDVSMLRARQRLLMFGRHLLDIEEPVEMRLMLLEEIEHLATRLKNQRLVE